MTAAAIPVRMASVAMTEDFYRCAIFQVVIAAVKCQPVMGLDGDGFVGIPLHDMGDAVDVITHSLVLTAFHFHIQGRTGVLGAVKSGSVDIVRNAEKCQHKNGAYR